MTDKIIPTIRKRSPASPSPAPVAATGPGEGAYDVGYGKPPRHSQFKKGVSGNPRGRPKDAKGVKTIVRAVLEAKVAVQSSTGSKKMSKLELAIHKQVEKACKGDLRALEAVLKHYDNGSSSESSAGGQHTHLSLTDQEILNRYRTELLANPDTATEA